MVSCHQDPVKTPGTPSRSGGASEIPETGSGGGLRLRTGEVNTEKICRALDGSVLSTVLCRLLRNPEIKF